MGFIIIISVSPRMYLRIKYFKNHTLYELFILN
ncbi:hypothetical protein OE09_1344 [Flavobacteriaceae bacterium MAR_2010_72]|nr:hypothetical protein OE09_1344 [Flavobacteriaceae bacterium MAR_2010_72]